MSLKEKNLAFRGDIRALIAVANDLAWVTQHPQKQPTALFRLNLESSELTCFALPAGATCLASDGQTIWIGGEDAAIYRLTAKEKQPVKLCDLPECPSKLIYLATEKLALIADKLLLIVGASGKVEQQIALPDAGTAVGADPTGNWLCVGLSNGFVQVYEAEEKSEFRLSESEKLHTGTVSALLFEPEELRFFSTGQDLKLLLTHARGKLEPEDRGRGSMHEAVVTSIVNVPGDRIITGSRDKSCKSWTRAGATKPATLADSITEVVSMATIEIHQRPHLAIACGDNSIRLFLLDAGGRFGGATHRFDDGYELAHKFLTHEEPSQREKGLEALAGYNDDRAAQMLANHVGSEKDHRLRLQAAQSLVATTSRQATKLLQPLLKNADGAVRLAAFDGLCQKMDATPMEPIRLALKADQVDIGLAAVNLLLERSKRDEVALSVLVGCLDHALNPVRVAGQLRLEEVYQPNSPDANLRSLQSKKADSRILGLVRLLQREQLSDRRVQSALRRAGEDDDAEVRRHAFLVSLLADAQLANAIRTQDESIDRQLGNIEKLPRDYASWVSESSSKAIAGSQDATQKDSTKPDSTSQVTIQPDSTQQTSEAGSAKQSKAKAKSKGKSAGDESSDSTSASSAPAPSAQASSAQVNAGKLSAEQLAPLLSAMASRQPDTSLRGAYALAVLRDERALGVLLQLSRESDAKARREVCVALAALADAQAIQRLESMLDDVDQAVRDVAYSGFAKITADDPIKAAAAGLLTSHEDVRRRGLTTLVSHLRKLLKDKDAASSDKLNAARQLLVRALNDGATAIRQEAFKAALSMEIDGSPDATLKFLLSSVHADIRREVLTEVIAQDKQPWAAELLQQLFSDPDRDIRREAFEHANQKSKGKDLVPLEAALQSRFPDTRLLAISAIAKLATSASQQALLVAINDSDRDVRQAALKAIIDHAAGDQVRQAMSSQFEDIRLQAACMRAGLGDPAALQPLCNILATTEPQDSEPKQRWIQSINAALCGLAALGDSAARPSIEPLLAHKNDSIRESSVQALGSFWDASAVDLLQSAMRDSTAAVRNAAALGLSCAGESAAMPVILEQLSQDKKYVAAYLRALVLFGEASERRLLLAVDDATVNIAQSAQFVLLARDYWEFQQTPRRTLACLSASIPRSRLLAAEALEAFGNRQALFGVFREMVNVRMGDSDWNVLDEDIAELMKLIALAPRTLQSATLPHLLKLFEEKKQEVWLQAWHAFRTRLQQDDALLPQMDELNRIAEAAANSSGSKLSSPTHSAGEDAASQAEPTKKTRSKKSISSETSSAESPASSVATSSAKLTEIALGTYVTLIREQGNSNRRKQAYGNTVIPVCLTAIRRLMAMAIATDGTAHPDIVSVIRPVLVHACTDPDQAVRLLAFESLEKLGVDTDTRAFIAIESRFADVAIQGMQLLTQGSSTEAARQILSDVIVNHPVQLSREAMGLLSTRTSRTEAATVGITSTEKMIREEAVAWLLAAYPESNAKKQLDLALESKFDNVRLAAAIGLAMKKDSKAFDPLLQLLKNGNKQAISALAELGDPRAADAALEIVASRTNKDLDGQLLSLVGSFRSVHVVEKLLAMLDSHVDRELVAAQLWKISGHDQGFAFDQSDQEEAINEKDIDLQSLAKQFPRNDEVLAKLLQRSLNLGWYSKDIVSWLDAAQRSQSNAVDGALQQFALLPQEKLRQQAVAALAWRLRKRNGDAKPLLLALEHRDPLTKFYAARGLAHAKRAEGLQVLMSAVELLSDLNLRHLAVRALGQLAHPVSIDFLLKLAGDDLHALQEVAAIAIGHFNQSAESEKVFAILKRFLQDSTNYSLARSACIGLRYFNSRDAWQLIREQAQNDSAPAGLQNAAALQLQYNDDPASKELLLKILRTSIDWSEFLQGARRLFGTDSIEPDLAVVQNDTAVANSDARSQCIQRVCQAAQTGDVEFAGKVVRLYSRINEDVRARVFSSLLARSELPTNVASELLQSTHSIEVEISAHILGRSNDKKNGKVLEAALSVWLKKYQADIGKFGQLGDADRQQLQECVTRLIWACSRSDAGKAELIQLCTNNASDADFAELRIAAACSLANLKLTDAELQSLAVLLSDQLSQIRQAIAALLASSTSSDATETARASDRELFEVTRRGSADWTRKPSKSSSTAWDSACQDPHRQAIVAVGLVDSQQVDSLARVAADGSLDDGTRLGAIEMLSQIPLAESRKQIQQFATNSQNDEDLRKAAWRALRRCKRLEEANS